MANTANLQEVMQTLLEILLEMHKLGEQITAFTAEDQLDEILDLVATRVATSERLKDSPLPDGIRLPDLLEHPDPGLRSLAYRVRGQVQAVMEQDKQLQEKLICLRSKVSSELQRAQLALRVDRTYHPPLFSTGGAFLDKKR